MKRFPAAVIPAGDEEETKTMCPACRGSGKSELVPVSYLVWKWVACDYCEGEGLVPASRASGFRRRAVVE